MPDTFIEAILITNLATLKIYKTKEETGNQYTGQFIDAQINRLQNNIGRLY